MLEIKKKNTCIDSDVRSKNLIPEDLGSSEFSTSFKDASSEQFLFSRAWTMVEAKKSERTFQRACVYKKIQVISSNRIIQGNKIVQFSYRRRRNFIKKTGWHFIHKKFKD